MLNEIWQATPTGRNYFTDLLSDEESEPTVIAKQPCKSAPQPKRVKIEAVNEQVLTVEEHKAVTLECIANALEKIVG